MSQVLRHTLTKTVSGLGRLEPEPRRLELYPLSGPASHRTQKEITNCNENICWVEIHFYLLLRFSCSCRTRTHKVLLLLIWRQERLQKFLKKEQSKKSTGTLPCLMGASIVLAANFASEIRLSNCQYSHRVGATLMQQQHTPDHLETGAVGLM